MTRIDTTEQNAYAGKVIVVTGAAGGIGLELAQSLAAAGAHVVAADADVVAAKHAIASFPGCYATAYDAADAESKHALITRTVNKLGHIDAVINSTGILSVEPLVGSLDLCA